ncbi:MAG TPA: FecR family protein [Pyrinomonadaceae bacterium]|nr:FecR family protein [Pyrinomonadaceae bacterium]
MRKAYLALASALSVVAMLSIVPSVSTAQTRDKFIISARAGGVNAVTGRATVRGRRNEEWQQLMITENLERGDVVKTGHDGRVEVLLNPGSYLRLAENSEFELSNDSLENLELRLVRGTAIMEVTGADDAELLINIVTPHTRMAIVRRGLYRVNVVPENATELIVRKGRVVLEGTQTRIKGGNKVVFSAGQPFSIAKLNKDDKRRVDTFEVWSKERAETVAQANRRIRSRDVNLLWADYNSSWGRGGSAWSRGMRFGGMWVYNPLASCYTFMPFYSGWGSPYGGSYSSAFYRGYYGGNYCCGNRSYPTTGNSNPGVGPAGRPATGSPNSSPTYRPPDVPMRIESRVERLNDRRP